jgi:hypothetical protein
MGHPVRESTIVPPYPREWLESPDVHFLPTGGITREKHKSNYYFELITAKLAGD